MASSHVSGRERALIIAAFASVYILWGSTYLAMHVLVRSGFTPFLGAALRMAIAGLLMLAYSFARGFPLPPRRTFIHFAVCGILYMVGGNGLTMLASQRVPSSLIALLGATTPFWLTAGAAFIPPRERPSLVGLSGTILGFVGVMLLVGGDVLEAPIAKQSGVAFSLLAPIFWACAALWSKKTLLHLPSSVTAAWQMLTGSAALAVLGFSLGEAADFHPQPSGYWSFAFLVIGGSLLGYNSFAYLLQRVPATKVSTYSYVNPVVACLLGWWVLDERLRVEEMIGAGIILSGVVLVNAGKVKRG